MARLQRDGPNKATITVDVSPEGEGDLEPGKILDRGPGALFVISQESLTELVAHIIDYIWNHSNVDVSPILLHEAIESFVRGNRQQADEQSPGHEQLHAAGENAGPPR
jgi:hypothetical protein